MYHIRIKINSAKRSDGLVIAVVAAFLNVNSHLAAACWM